MFFNATKLNSHNTKKLISRNLCIHANTLLPTENISRSSTVKELYDAKMSGEKLGKIWSYDVNSFKYELVDFDIKKNKEKKEMIDVILEDDTIITCTKNQKFLDNTTKKYKKASQMKHKMTTPFLRQLKIPSWCVCSNVRNENLLVLDTVKTDQEKKFDAYKVVVKKNKNFAITTEIIKNVECGVMLVS